MRSVAMLILSAVALGQTSTELKRPTESVIRSWPEMIEVDGKKVDGKLEYVFDYSSGEAIERQYDGDGRLVREVQRPKLDIAASESEIALAYELVRRDPELGRFLEQEGRRLDGGFVLREENPSPCGDGSRCIHVVAFAVDETHPVFNAVVDLVSTKVIYRNFKRTREVQQ